MEMGVGLGDVGQRRDDVSTKGSAVGCDHLCSLPAGAQEASRLAGVMFRVVVKREMAWLREPSQVRTSCPAWLK